MQAHRSDAPRSAHALPWIVAGAFFIAYVGTAAVGARPPLSSPDETANRYFAMRVAESGSPVGPADPAGSIVHPRSVGVRGERWLPNTFIGLPLLYGSIGRVVGVDTVALVLPPLLAVLGAVALQ